MNVNENNAGNFTALFLVSRKKQTVLLISEIHYFLLHYEHEKYQIMYLKENSTSSSESSNKRQAPPSESLSEPESGRRADWPDSNTEHGFPCTVQ